MATKKIASARDKSARKFDFERKPFYSPAEVAKILDVSTQTILDRIHDGKLYAIRISPRVYRIPIGGLMIFLGEPPRITRITRRVKRLPDWDREFAEEHKSPRR